MMLLYAPLAGAVCSAHFGNCCAGDYCPIARHHHRHDPSQPAGDMQCEHGGVELTRCSMHCCHPTEQTAVNAIWLVLPAPAALSFGNPHSTPVASVDSTADFLKQAPDSPPPRLALA
jgi:hypothetical protein